MKGFTMGVLTSRNHIARTHHLGKNREAQHRRQSYSDRLHARMPHHPAQESARRAAVGRPDGSM